MSTQDFSDKIGSSPSPAIERVIENNTGVQKDYPTPAAALADAYNKHPVTDLGKTQ